MNMDGKTAEAGHRSLKPKRPQANLVASPPSVPGTK